MELAVDKGKEAEKEEKMEGKREITNISILYPTTTKYLLKKRPKR